MHRRSALPILHFCVLYLESRKDAIINPAVWSNLYLCVSMCRSMSVCAHETKNEVNKLPICLFIIQATKSRIKLMCLSETTFIHLQPYSSYKTVYLLLGIVGNYYIILVSFSIVWFCLSCSVIKQFSQCVRVFFKKNFWVSYKTV